MGGRSHDSISISDSHELERNAKRLLRESSDSPHLFISFTVEDEDAVNLLRGQAKNPDTELQFDDFSLKDAINSHDDDYIKRKIRERIDRVSVTAVYLTPASANSKWVTWEIEESLRRGKGVIGVHPGDKPPSKLPSPFHEHGLPVVRWSHSALKEAIANASATRESSGGQP